MERFTVKLPDDLGIVPKQGYGWPEIAAKLAAYEDAEEQGRLIVLPCKVGDTVYTNTSWSGWYLRESARPYKARVVFAGLNNSENMGGGVFNVVYAKGQMMQFRFSDIGKTVFLTREEAEKALEGMKNG